MCPISGGNWNNSSMAGVLALNCNNVRGNSNDNVGFRADSASPHAQRCDRGAKGDAFLPATQRAKSACFRPSGRAGAGLEGWAT